MVAAAQNENERYQEYLCSRKWNEKKEAVRRRSGGKCERCIVNDMQACHHKTYARKYDERLDDLVAICDECHKFIHAKSDTDVRFVPWRIYLSGGVDDRWRSDLVSSDLGIAGLDSWPILARSVSATGLLGDDGPDFVFDYCGPFFSGFDQYCLRQQSAVVARCDAAISACDIFFAWIDSLDSCTALTEIGIASRAGKKVYVGISDTMWRYERLWYASTRGEALFGPTAASCLWQALAFELSDRSISCVSYPLSERN